MRADAARRVAGGGLALLVLVSWLVPGAGHLWLGRRSKGFILLAALIAMFAIGLWLDGRLFPFELSQPLVLLAAIADAALGVPYAMAWAFGLGQGQPAAVTYEYANAFLIAAGLLNMLTVLDAYDTALGRKGGS
jgi:hypothetical protein